MPDVSFTIAQRPYTLRCAAGQEARLEAAAADLAERVASLAARAGGGDDRQLLVIAALELLDALHDAQAAKAETDAAKAEAAELRAWVGTVAERIDALSQGLDPLVPAAKDAKIVRVGLLGAPGALCPGVDSLWSGELPLIRSWSHHATPTLLSDPGACNHQRPCGSTLPSAAMLLYFGIRYFGIRCSGTGF